MAPVAPVVEGHRGPVTHGVVEDGQGRQRRQVGEGPDPGRRRKSQAPQSIATTRIAEVDAGHGKVQCRLLVGRQIQIGQVEIVGSDEVADLLGTVDRRRRDLDAPGAQRPFVALESLAPGFALRRVPRHLGGDLAQRLRSFVAQQDEDQVCQTFEPVHHRRQRRRPRSPHRRPVALS